MRETGAMKYCEDASAVGKGKGRGEEM